ncbi:MAG: ribonucleoside-triphosphate reductase [Candidatus Vogelbacteria bacterium]|nr:ribonucleoside-triphosphate reductase [Candidatus Vogelbacteria bacterium]
MAKAKKVIKKAITTPKTVSFVQKITKRDGTVAKFDINKVASAVLKAMKATGEGGEKEALKVANQTLKELKEINKTAGKNFVPSVEQIQDLVEKSLIMEQFAVTAKAYILYRQRRTELRQELGEVPQHVKDLAEKSKQYFRNPLGEFVYYRTYSRWIEEEGRRETWIETVDRYLSFMKENIGNKLTDKEYEEVREAILNHQAMPSMRLLQFAGKASRNTNVCAYNCSFIAPKTLKDFAEVMYISMCGTGVGFSVESKNIQLLPIIKEQTGKHRPTFVVADSKEGWCDALVYGLETWFTGEDVEFDFSLLRPAGARLKIMGGKSSGPEPLRQLLSFSREKILRRQGKRLTNIDAHDILCKIGEIVVSGGVRRSAMISLSDLDDEQIRHAKHGQFYLTEPQRSLANNSAVYNNKPSNTDFLEEWIALMKSGSGERGIFNRGGLATSLPKRRLDTLKGQIGELGTNPCGEIILQSKQFCNLSEIVARHEDTEASLMKKMKVAAILGTFQSTLTNFPYLSKEWRENCETERLLGVSVTGMWDSHVARDPKVLRKLKEEAIKVNKVYAKRFGVNESTAITCVKPSGTLSQMVDCASGMHPRHAQYYIRRVRISATDSLFKMLRDQGVPYHPEVGQALDSATTYVFEFPVKAPEKSLYKDDMGAVEQLKYWKLVKENYTEHNPSVTVSVREDEWIEVAHWVFSNWEIVGGLSFLPSDNHVYQLAPYEKIDEKRYKEMLKNFGDIDYSKIISYEKHDETEQKKELACAGGVCEIV